MSEPSIGRIVHYRLSADDAERINKRRKDARASGVHRDATGYVVHVGNDVAEGQIFPAMIVRVWPDSCNLQVHLDGDDCYWAISHAQGPDVGQWHFPEVQ